MHKNLAAYLSELIPKLSREGIVLLSEQEIAYGIQLVLSKDKQKNSLNVYYSEKKGISLVPGGQKGGNLYSFLHSISGQTKESVVEPSFHEWQSWIGSDECGKGDYLGGLVVSAFLVHRNETAQLRKLGVTDSKNLRDERLTKIAMEIYRLFPKRIACIVLKPQKYNEIYSAMQSQGKNLNDLLAWQHSKVISELVDKNASLDGILVDQFSKSMKVKKLLLAKEVSIPIVERPKAEADIAVATASILSRYQFLQLHASLARFFNTEIPLGTSKGTCLAAKKFVSMYGKERLREIAKLHFVTTKAVLEAPPTEIA